MNRCLFCKSSSNSFNSVEHIIPESFGSKKVVLPKGIVCDKCNNYFSVKLEGPLLSHTSFRNIRAWHQVPSKKGKFPTVQGHIGGTDIKINLRLTDDNKFDVRFENEQDQKKYGQEYIGQLLSIGQSPLIFTMDFEQPKKEMSRFLAKMGLEALAYRFLGLENFVDKIIEEPHYDRIRNHARFGDSDRDWPYSQRRIFPIETQMRHPESGEWVQTGFGHNLFMTQSKETYFAFLLYGMEYVINVGGPSIKGYENWLNKHADISPLIERVGAKVVSKQEGGSVTHFIEGELDAKKGVEFDAIEIKQ